MAVTSSTTAVAFLANALSEITPIRGFGIYAAIIVPINFIMVILLIPPATILNETVLEKYCSFSCLKRCCCRKKKGGDAEKEVDADVPQAKEALMTRFFGGPFNLALFKLRYVVTAIGTLAGCFVIYYATKIGPLSKQEDFLPPNTPIVKLNNIINDEFAAIDSNKNQIKVKIFWGVKDLDKKDVGLWDATDLGELVWDPDFTVSPRRNQAALLELCRYLRNDSELVQFNKVECWIEDFDEWLQEEFDGAYFVPIADPVFFDQLLLKFVAESTKGQKAATNFRLGFVKQEDDEDGNPRLPKLQFTFIEALSIGDEQQPSSVKEPIFDSW